MLHGFKLFGFRIKVFERYEQMPAKTYQAFAESCKQDKHLIFKQLFLLFDLSNFGKKLLSFVLTTEEILMVRGFWDFFWEKNNHLLPSAEGLWTNGHWAFIQFVRVLETYQRIQKLHKLSGQFQIRQKEIDQELDKLIAIAYLPIGKEYDEDEMRIRAKYIENFSPTLKAIYHEQISQKFIKIINRNTTVFPKREDQEAESQKGSWLEVIRIMAENPVYFEQVAQMNAESALFNLSGLIKDQQKLKKS